MFSSQLIIFIISYSCILKFFFINFFSLRLLIFFTFFIFHYLIFFFIRFYDHRSIHFIILKNTALGSFICCFNHTTINLTFSIRFFCSQHTCSFRYALFQNFHLFFLSKCASIKTISIIVGLNSLDTLSIFLYCVFFIYCFCIFNN